MRTTHTYALLPVNDETHREIKALLLAAGYDHAVNEVGELDMHGIALVPIAEEDCPNHVASRDDAKRCARCGIHIDDLRPPDEEEPQ